MAKSKKRTLTLTENEVLAAASMTASLVWTGGLTKQHTPQMHEEFESFFMRLANMASAITGKPIRDEAEMRDALAELLDDRHRENMFDEEEYDD